jgi:hypothetical protein
MDEPKTNRQFWVAITFIAALAKVSFVIKVVVNEMAQPVNESHDTEGK